MIAHFLYRMNHSKQGTGPPSCQPGAGPYPWAERGFKSEEAAQVQAREEGGLPRACRAPEATFYRAGQSPGGLHASPWQRKVSARPDWPRRRARGLLGEHVPAAAALPVWTWRAPWGLWGGRGLFCPFPTPGSWPTAGPGLGPPRAPSPSSWRAPGGRG